MKCTVTSPKHKGRSSVPRVTVILQNAILYARNLYSNALARFVMNGPNINVKKTVFQNWIYLDIKL
jgi:hypothetical protein